MYILTFLLVSLWTTSRSEQIQSSEVEVFRKLFQEKRLYQLSGVKQLLSLEPQKQTKLLDAMILKITKVLTDNKVKLIESGYEVQGKALPENEKLKESLALVLENTCFASDLLLRFPHFMHKKLKEIPQLDPVFKWSLGFTQQLAGDLLDSSVVKLMDLALQEMGLIEQSKDFNNPYKKKDLDEKDIKKIKFVETHEAEKKEKKKKKLKKGPRLSRNEL